MTSENSQNTDAKNAPLALEPAESQADAQGLQMALAAVRAAFDKKAEKIKVLDLRGQSSVADFFVICSAMSDRQVQAICEHIHVTLKSQGHHAIASEGLTEGRWVLLDFGTLIVHVFLDAIRDYYDIEGLWKNAGRITLPPEFFAPAATQTPARHKLN